MRLKVVVPVITEKFVEPTRKEVEKFISGDTEVDVQNIRYGTASIEARYDEMLCALDILRIVKKAEREGFDGVYIDCMGDPGVEEAREVVDIPVVGPARVSMLVAADLAHRFSVITVLKNVIPLLEEIAVTTRIVEKLASVRSVDIPVLGLEKEGRLLTALVSESKRAVNRDGAHALVLGCTGMRGVAKRLQKSLKEEDYNVPVIYPVALGIKYLELLVSLNLSQSKKTYMHPPEKERNVWEKLEK
ncbi:MAG: hydrogenase expression protein HupH [Candidatus Korarchaeota archaeon]|nr:hydrogenase expression protein HupH [Candidatus Korarchaeota archaeon]NIU82094.1 hydrogenase expression protein HupH [Candidatus Thorarchaeota archaeon]NIW12505.1 hydrogenase expression protein HupH [Candidatus Thorarchaeota archaeon]NIW50724.1 hydrogenase expression protein HupH [Candidatus Korarchaeota archaeon]